MTLWEILDGRSIVAVDCKNRVLYTWNGSLILQTWACDVTAKGASYTSRSWIELDIRTLQDVPGNLESARLAAYQWQQSILSESASDH